MSIAIVGMLLRWISGIQGKKLKKKKKKKSFKDMGSSY